MRVNGTPYRTVWMEDGVVKMIDQRRLPFDFTICSLPSSRETAAAIQDMTVRYIVAASSAILWVIYFGLVGRVRGMS